jgi:xylulokinase
MKAILLDGAGAQGGLATEPTPFVRRPAGVEMDLADLEAALGRLLERLGAARHRLAAAGVAGMAESGAPMDGGRVVAPILAWHDGRGEETVARLDRHFGDALPRRIGQRVRSVSSVAKLGWLLEHGLSPPPRRWLGVPELCLYVLTGAEATEHSLAARTGAYDVVRGEYMPDVVEFLGLRPGTFGPVAPAGTVMGRVTAPAGARYGLPEGIPVTVAGHDHLAAAVGLRPDDGDLLNSVGTAETLLRRHPRPPDIERSLALGLAVTVWPGGRDWGVLASVTRSGLVLSALASALGAELDELDRLAATDGGETVEGLVPDLVPWLELRSAEAPTPEVPKGPPGAVWATALRELAARTGDTAARLASLLGPHRRMVVFGGGSRSRPWVAAKAAVAGLPVLRSTAPEATARGAALAAGAAAGWWPSPSAGPLPPLEPVDPAPD